MVCSQPLFPAARGGLATGDGEGEEDPDIHLPPGLVEELRLWDTGNYRNRVLNPLAEEAGAAQTEFSDPASHDGNTGAEHGFGERHSGAPAAREGRHNGQRVHAGVAGEREEDGRRRVRHAHKRRESEDTLKDLPQKAANSSEELAVSI